MITTPSPPLPGGYRFGTVLRESDMRCSAPVFHGHDEVIVLEAGSLPELCTAALAFIHQHRIER